MIPLHQAMRVKAKAELKRRREAEFDSQESPEEDD